MKIKIFYIVLFFTLFMNTVVFAQNNEAEMSSNLALNPSFEEGEINDPYFWSKSSWEEKGKFLWDDTQSHSGNRSVCIINNKETDSRYKQQISVKPSTYYKISCWTKTENVGMNSKGANISIDGLLITSNEVKGTSAEWQYLELVGLTGEKQNTIFFTLGLGGYSSVNIGKAWFDDVFVEELKEAPDQASIPKLTNDDNLTAESDKNGSQGIKFFIILLISIAFITYGVFKYQSRNSNKKDGKATQTKGMPAKIIGDSKIIVDSSKYEKKLKLDKKDFIIMGSMTLIYLVLALVNLGSFSVPETNWTPFRPGESITLEFDKEVNLSKIYYYCGLGKARPNEGKYRLQYEDSQGNFISLATIEKKDLFIWKWVDIPKTMVKKLKIIVDVPGATINEFAFFEKGSTKPIDKFQIIEKDVDAQDEGKVENLFDEQTKVDYKHSYLSGMIFDEIYHARTAYEYLNQMEPFEWTHPPLGKLFISLGIAIFGMTPFGWRISGTLFGVAMIPIMYLFGRKLFSKKFYGFCSAFLMMFDFMHFGLSRIATIDVYGTFFVMLMYYFMCDYVVNKSYNLGFKESLRPLLLTGIVFGLGATSKWIGLYAGGGLAFLFFLTKYYEYKDYKVFSRKISKKTSVTWLSDFIPIYIIKTFIYCVLFFVIIPIVIYCLSYIPYMRVPGPGHGLDLIFRNQVAMLKYHSHDVLNSTHPFSSFWWEWPLIRRPLETYAGSELPAGMSSTMTIMGNPAIWWVGIAAIILSIIIAVTRKDKKMIVVFAAIASQYLPWIGITRIVFIYHFFSVVPFMILSIVYVIKYFIENYKEAKYIVFAYLAIVLILFIMFYPVLSGMEVNRDYVTQYLLWFKQKWVF